MTTAIRTEKTGDCSCGEPPIKAPAYLVAAAGHPELQEVLEDYMRGIYHGDLPRLRRAFHPQATLSGVVKGLPYGKNREDYLAIVASRQSPEVLGEPFAMRLLTLEVRSDIALARLHCPIFGFNYLDFLSLHQHDGRWQIRHKLFTDLPSGATP